MNDIRARFEEIWPVPEGVYWHETACDYMTLDGIDDWQDQYFQRVRDSYAARLDTFTRCQETTAVYVGIVDELIGEMELVLKRSNDLGVIGIARESIVRAKQKLEQIK